MWGAIAGDIIGSPYEAGTLKTAEFPLFSARSSVTDDSVLTVATADALLSDEPYDEVYREYARRYPLAGYGEAFRQWAQREYAGPYNSWGNGSAMRVSPVAYARDTLEQVLAEAKRSSEVTHSHPEGILGAQAAAGAVFLARTQGGKERVRAFVEDELRYDLREPLDSVRAWYRFDVSCRGTIPVAVKSFLEGDDWESTVRLAVSMGGDSDTLASIAGAIAEAHYGSVPAGIADRARSVVEFQCPALLPVIDEFCAAFPIRPG